MKTVEQLNKISKSIRIDVIDMLYKAKSGHPGGSLSCVDILVNLYYNELNLGLNNDNMRIDKVILSKGHAAPAYYAVLSSLGYIPREELFKLRQIDGILEGHPSIKINGVDSSSGSLGQGLSIANGMALSKKISDEEGYIYCLLGDGELEEGQIWEALMSSNKYNLKNLIIVIDSNGLQIDGNIQFVKALEKIEEKISSFGLNVLTIDGHSHKSITSAIKEAKSSNKPTCIIANTIKGKGVSFMQNDASWHGKKINDEDYKMAINELSIRED